MNLRSLHLILAAVIVAACSSAEDPLEPDVVDSSLEGRMNVVLITGDDLGLQLSSYGDEAIETPNLDALAAGGVQFDIAYAAQAICSPSRAAIFTGLYPHSNGQYGLSGGDTALHPHLLDATLPNILKREGYRTGIVGKLHVAPENSFRWDMANLMDGRDVRGMANSARAFIWQNTARPFFLMVNYFDPHAYRETDPNTRLEVGKWFYLDQFLGFPSELLKPSEKTVLPFQRIDSPKQRVRVASYYNEIKRLDEGIGLLLAALEGSPHADNTLVIFVSDHGPPFDRGKTTVYEAGLRVPFLVRWPGVSRPGRSRALVSLVDILPTVLDATSTASPVETQGKSLRGLVDGSETSVRDYLVGESHLAESRYVPRRAIRDDRYKLIHNLLSGRAIPNLAVNDDIAYATSRRAQYDDTAVRRAFETLANPPEIELYDLETDPWEFNNLAGQVEYAETEARLRQALLDWRQETEDPFLDQVFLRSFIK